MSIASRHAARPVRVPRAPAALALLCLLAWGFPAAAGITDAAPEDLEVALLTYGPGEIYWERFGHDAIELRDTASGESVAFNYGLFDFGEEDFLLNFIRGRMHYQMGAVETPLDIATYAAEGRSVERQVLALEPAARERLRSHLLWNLQPENLRYAYRYYTDNCTTRLRNAIDLALGGELRAALAAQRGQFTWREHTLRLMRPQPALMFLLDLGLAGRADRPLDAWEESFLPAVLAARLESVETPAGHLLVAASGMLAPSHHPAPPAGVPDLRLPLGAAGAGLAGLLLLAGRGRGAAARRLFTLLAGSWLLVAGLAGALMLFLWLATAHDIAWANANLLLFNPLAWLLLPAAARRQPGRHAHLLAWILALSAATALGLCLTHSYAQRNLPWILLALPVWAVLLHVLRRRAEADSATP